MRKIGKEVFFYAADKTYSRTGEGGFIRLKDESILYVFTAYVTEEWLDHGEAVLVPLLSRDEGESWEMGEPIVRRDEGKANVMSVSLLRMQNGDIGLFYLQKLEIDGVVCDEYLLRRSSDEGKTWGEPTVCIAAKPGTYYVVNNDRVIRLSTGRILIPTCSASARPKEDMTPGNISKVTAFYSDDDGATWVQSDVLLETPFDNDKEGLQEPGALELPDGRVWLWTRTDLGFQYEAFSSDGGLTFSGLRPNKFFTSPLSPMQVRRVGDKYTVSIFNPVPKSCQLLKAQEGTYWRTWWGRTPYLCSVSEDGGLSFPRSYYLEDDPKNDYCYAAILEGDDYFLAAYYHSNNTPICLNSLKIVKVKYDEIATK